MGARHLVTRGLLAGTLALGVSIATVPSAHASASAYIATPNGVVGIQQTIVISVPSLANQVATIGFTSGGISNAGQTTLNGQGIGSLNWVPTSAGAWTVSGLGSAISAGSTTINVAAMPTTTVLLVPNMVQRGANVTVTALVTAQGSQVPPAGTVTVRNQNANVVATGTLQASSGTTSVANMNWVAATSSNDTLQATFSPSGVSFQGSTSAVQQPQYSSSQVIVALRFPPVLYVGSPTLLGAEIGQGVTQGSASFQFDGNGITGSIATVNGVASAIWSPPASGIHTISTTFTSSDNQFSNSSSQIVNIQGPLAQDTVTVTPAGGAPWNPGAPIVVQSGSTTQLTVTSGAGAPVSLNEVGPCVINGSALVALAPGQCTVTASSVGTTTVTPDTNTYVLTVQAAPPAKKKRR